MTTRYMPTIERALCHLKV